MARLRTLKPEFFTHELLCELTPLHRLLYEGLWCYADRDGRLEDRPRYLKTVVLPYDACDVDSMLADLHAKGFVVRYQANGKHCIAIPAFPRHQKPHPREAPSLLPPPPPASAQVIEMSKAIPRQDLGVAEPYLKTAEQDLGAPQPGGLGDLGLGGICLGELQPALPSQIPDALEVYAHYRETFHRRQPEPNASQRDRILCALREGYDVQELKRAIDGLANSDWHRKRNFLGLDHVLKDRETIERCIGWATAPPDIPDQGKAAGPPRRSEGMTRSPGPGCEDCGAGDTANFGGRILCYRCWAKVEEVQHAG